ncbi:MAG: class I poly(R)-hydroxyalkanoic acid synthase [Pseudomonadota bacterium]
MQAGKSEDQSGTFAQAGGAFLQGLGNLFPAGSEASRVWQSLIEGHSADPARLGALQNGFLQQHLVLWGAMLARESGVPLTGSVDSEDQADKRFAGRAWRDNPYHDYLRQAYQLNSRFLGDLVEAAKLEEPAKQRLRFYTRQLIDAMSPANFAATNPEALRLALDTRGESLNAGIRQLIADIERGRISTTDEFAFEVGGNLAVTPGAVVFENELMQLIQYTPTTAKVRKVPLMMVPPCINKFYILDLQPENSFVRYAVEQGNTVFMVSWRNITEASALTWDDYVAEGVLKPLEVVRAISKSDKINALGFCVGGTLLAAALAVLRARGEDRAASVTLLATMLDYTYPGDIGVFVDEASVAARERAIGKGGILPGKELALVFSALRANDLVWAYVVNNYLKGRTPAAFDILYWNADSTNLPGPMYCWFVRNMYLDNKLREPGKLVVCGVPVDLGAIRLPTYILATREDHIVPWNTAYLSTRHLKGDTRFVLGASGHVAGVINPASKNRRSYWTNDDLSGSAEEWLAGAEETPGSWWSNWDTWLERFSGGARAAPKKPGNAKFKPIEPAPGKYVKVRV